MVEKGFVDSLQKSIRKGFSGTVIIKPSDNFSLGIPDLLIWMPVATSNRPWSIAIEAKQLRPLMADPFHRGRRTGMMLKHPFSGPQWSMLCKMKGAGVDAFGLVRASRDTAFRIEPTDIKESKGNFTHEEMVKFGYPVHRVDGIWKFWREHDQVPSSRHRDNS